VTPSIAPAEPTKAPISLIEDWQAAPTYWHTLRNQDGKEISAQIDSFQGDDLVLTTTNSTHTYPISKLSWESQRLIQEIQKIRMRPQPQALPPTGVIWGLVSQSYTTGPLAIQTRFGSGNYYIKLVDTSSGATRMVLFVREGDTTSELVVPAGSYEMRYATGSTWYGEELLFGESTQFHKADSIFSIGNGRGYTVELYLQHDGNLQTKSLNKEDF
jgi:hypothetical protein